MHGWTLVLVLAALTKLRSERTLRWAALTGAAWGLCFLVAAYTGLMATAFVVAFTVADLVARRSGWEWLWTCSHPRRHRWCDVARIPPGRGCGRLRQRTRRVTVARHGRHLQSFGATPADFLLPVERHPVLGLVGHLRASNRVLDLPRAGCVRRLRRPRAGPRHRWPASFDAGLPSRGCRTKPRRPAVVWSYRSPSLRR